MYVCMYVCIYIYINFVCMPNLQRLNKMTKSVKSINLKTN